jgi:uncharacterized protein (TIGR02588 family)
MTEDSGMSSSKARIVENALAMLSACLIAAMIGYLFYAAIFLTPTPVALSVVAGPSDAGSIGFTVTNDGGQTASNVRVSLVLRDGDRLVDRRTVMLDYVPAHSEKTGAHLIEEEERHLDRDFVVEGYMDP